MRGSSLMRRDEMDTLFNVVAVNIRTGVQRILCTGKTERNADAFISMTVIRRGVETEFYKAIPATESLKL